MENRLKMLVRGALLLALAVAAQQLRFIIPLPGMATTLIIGTLVNAILVIASRHTGLFTAVVMCTALPVIAFLQGQLLLPLLIPVVFLGNLILVVLCNKWRNKPIMVVAAVAKTFVMYTGALLGFKLLAISPEIMQIVLIAMSWPQLLTAFLGILLARFLEKRLIL
jgi:hypothetical protein